MSLKIQFDENDHRPLIQLAEVEAIDRLEAGRAGSARTLCCYGKMVWLAPARVMWYTVSSLK